MPPAGLHSATLCKRPSAASARRREGCPRPRTRGREMKSTGDDKRVYRQAGLAARVPGEGPGKRDPARALSPRPAPPAPLAGAAGGVVSGRALRSAASASAKPPVESLAGTARARGCAHARLHLARAVTSGPKRGGVGSALQVARAACRPRDRRRLLDGLLRALDLQPSGRESRGSSARSRPPSSAPPRPSSARSRGHARSASASASRGRASLRFRALFTALSSAESGPNRKRATRYRLLYRSSRKLRKVVELNRIELSTS